MQYDYTWTTATGQKIQIDDMTENHAKNVLKLLFRQMTDYKASIKSKEKRQRNISDRIWEEHRDHGDWREADYKYNQQTGLFDERTYY